MERNFTTSISLRDLKHSQRIYRSIRTPLGNYLQFQFIKPTPCTKIRQKLQGQSPHGQFYFGFE